MSFDIEKLINIFIYDLCTLYFKKLFIICMSQKIVKQKF